MSKLTKSPGTRTADDVNLMRLNDIARRRYFKYPVGIFTLINDRVG